MTARWVMRLLAGAWVITGAWTAAAASPERPSFNQHIRPILSNNCFYCHGPDPKHREADLRLDTRDGAIQSAIVPGKPDESPLIARVASHDPDERMPPPASKKPHISDDDIATLRRWIEQGAEYEGHWAFLPLAGIAPPATKDTAWPHNGVDAFVLQKLEQAGIAPSPEAERATLIRRVYLDVLGLLPSPAEVEAFVADADPAAYERLVDRLLASPRFGERWGRHWLDQARYADSNGYTIDSEREMWPYRDWVIKALNDDMPFDQFTVEQLAGDLLPNPTKSQLIATAFHRNTLINEEGGTDREQFRNEAVVDRTNTTGAVWLGLTVGCAQCHTHKFDPITHREYYELFAFFNQGDDVNARGATVPVARGELFGAATAKPEMLGEIDKQLAARAAEWEKAQLAVLQPEVPMDVTWSPVKYEQYTTTSGASFQRLDDNSLLADGKAGPNDSYLITVRSDLKRIAAVRIKTLTHPTLPKEGPGTADNGNFVLSRVVLEAGGHERPFSAAAADHEQPRYAVTGALDDDPKTGWAINVHQASTAKMNTNHEAIFVLAEPLESSDGTFTLRLDHETNANYLIGRLAIEAAEKAPNVQARTDNELAKALRVPAAKRDTDQKKVVSTEFLKDPEAKRLTAAKNKLAAQVGDVMVMRRVREPRETFILQRGDFLRPDHEAGPLKADVLNMVPPANAMPAEPTRLDLAKWLVHPENPLTPRVKVNRVWMRYFGRGLVETDEDFGTQGASPTHPELLDWLAGELVRGGWSQKALHRLILTSATYRQASAARPELAEKDPRNLLLARQERVRVEAEIVRDAALSAAGVLCTKIGGPGVHPPQPEGVYAFTQNAKKWQEEQGEDRYRRAMYTVFFRSSPYPLFTTFDAPDFQTVCTRRPRSNTPLQSLTVANDAAFVEIARAIAARVLHERPTAETSEQIRYAHQLCVARAPSEQELAVLREYHDRQAERFEQSPSDAQSLLGEKDAFDMDDAPAAKAAALVSVARVLLNTDNFITRE